MATTDDRAADHVLLVTGDLDAADAAADAAQRAGAGAALATPGVGVDRLTALAAELLDLAEERCAEDDTAAEFDGDVVALSARLRTIRAARDHLRGHGAPQACDYPLYADASLLAAFDQPAL